VEITCNLIKPESAKVSALDLRVQVETRFGLSVVATVHFAQCGQACQHGGECQWSKDTANVACVCGEDNYGEWCENGSCPPVPAAGAATHLQTTTTPTTTTTSTTTDQLSLTLSFGVHEPRATCVCW
jgi:hypothetical protein